MCCSHVPLIIGMISGSVKDHIIDICWFAAKDTELRRKSKVLLARIQDNVTELNDVSTSELALLKSNTACWSNIQQTSSSHQTVACPRIDIVDKLLSHSPYIDVPYFDLSKRCFPFVFLLKFV